MGWSTENLKKKREFSLDYKAHVFVISLTPHNSLFFLKSSQDIPIIEYVGVILASRVIRMAYLQLARNKPSLSH